MEASSDKPKFTYPKDLPVQRASAKQMQELNIDPIKGRVIDSNSARIPTTAVDDSIRTAWLKGEENEAITANADVNKIPGVESSSIQKTIGEVPIIPASVTTETTKSQTIENAQQPLKTPDEILRGLVKNAK
jgi:hypothetical protein